MTSNTLITFERLQELEILEASMSGIVEAAIKEYKTTTLRKLHERDKLNPAAINLRVKRYTEKHRDEINQKRRDKRKAEKLNTILEESKDITLVNNTEVQRPIKIIRKYTIESAVKNAISASDCPIVRKILVPEGTKNYNTENKEVIIRFDT